MSEDFQTKVLQALERLAGSVERLEGKVDALQADLTDHRRGTNDSLERVLESMQALHAKVEDPPGPRRVAHS